MPAREGQSTDLTLRGFFMRLVNNLKVRTELVRHSGYLVPVSPIVSTSFRYGSLADRLPEAVLGYCTLEYIMRDKLGYMGLREDGSCGYYRDRTLIRIKKYSETTFMKWDFREGAESLIKSIYEYMYTVAEETDDEILEICPSRPEMTEADASLLYREAIWACNQDTFKFTTSEIKEGLERMKSGQWLPAQGTLQAGKTAI